VHPHDVRAGKDRSRGRRRAREEALVDRASGDRAEMALSRRSGEHRRNLTDFTEAAQERERFSGGLGGAEGGLDDDTLSLGARSLRTAVTARRSYCSGATSAWPGRDEAAPTSRMSAPSRSISTPRRTRASTSSPYPSPENESSVALRIPISNVRSRESCSAT